MAKQLRRQLIAPFTITIGLILTLVAIGILAISAREFNKKTLDSFQNQILNITSRLQSGSTVSCTWLSRLESDDRLIIHIEDNGRPPLYHGSWIPDTRQDTLIMRAREAAMAERTDPSSRPISSSLLRSSVFTVTGGSNDTYLGSVLVFPTQTGFQGPALPTSEDSMGFGLFRQGIPFLFLNPAGVAALMRVSWVLVGKSLKPLTESQKQQDEFTAAAPHELRAPPAIIHSSICTARTAPDQREKFMANIDREYSHMFCLVEDMLLLAPADTGQRSLRTPSLDTDTLLISIYERFKPLYQDKGVCLKLDLPKALLPRIYGDENRLEQIFAVLLDNTLHYTPKGRSVTVAASVQIDKHLLSRSRSMVCLTVSNQGSDMDDGTRKHIFNRFYRGDSAGSHKQNYGLRLSIAKELIQLHKGTISVSDSPGGGVCFLVRLPAVPESHASSR